jgi:IclR family acetate operon transcriptional repressor
MKKGNYPGSIRAIQRAFAILSCFSAERTSATLTELARQTDLPATTVTRVLSTLKSIHYVSRQKDGRYTVGSQLVRLALTALQSIRLYDIAAAYLERLSQETGETANLAIQDETGHAFYVQQVPSRQAIRHESWLGKTLPSKGSVNVAALRGEVGIEGFVSSRETIEKDVTAIAAPVFGPDKSIHGSFCVTGPSFRISDEDIKTIGECVVKAAREASLELGAPLDDDR